MTKLDFIKSKIKQRKELLCLLNILRFRDKKIVFTNGCFDIIHRGHVEYLSKARSLGDYMIVGLNTDKSVSKLKGENRPIQDEQSRALVLAGFSFVDAVVLFHEDTPYNIIKLFKPDILVKGADYKKKDIVGYDIIKSINGNIFTIELSKGFSTSRIIDRIK